MPDDVKIIGNVGVRDEGGRKGRRKVRAKGEEMGAFGERKNRGARKEGSKKNKYL